MVTTLTFLLVVILLVWTMREVVLAVVKPMPAMFEPEELDWQQAGIIPLLIVGAAAALGAGASALASRRARKSANAVFPRFLEFRNELLLGPGGFRDQITALRNDPLLNEAQTNLFRRAPGIIDDLESNLRTGALSSTSGGQVAALESARAAAGGRGGLAFGGGAHRIAAAGARAVAPQQATALAGALGQSAGLRLQNIQAQGDFAFNRRAQELALRQQFLSGSFSLASGAQQSIAQANQSRVGSLNNLSSGLFGLAGPAGRAAEFS